MMYLFLVKKINISPIWKKINNLSILIYMILKYIIFWKGLIMMIIMIMIIFSIRAPLLQECR